MTLLPSLAGLGLNMFKEVGKAMIYVVGQAAAQPTSTTR
jgi:hypothetical protein